MQFLIHLKYIAVVLLIIISYSLLIDIDHYNRNLSFKENLKNFFSCETKKECDGMQRGIWHDKWMFIHWVIASVIGLSLWFIHLKMDNII